jgi:hypothetical protein
MAITSVEHSSNSALIQYRTQGPGQALGVGSIVVERIDANRVMVTQAEQSTDAETGLICELDGTAVLSR